MNSVIKTHPVWGKALFIDNGTIEIGIPLEFGIRIGHLSYLGEENLFFEQPLDMEELATPEGWRVRGGHRLWVAPESKEVYYPDNSPISYEISDDKLMIFQDEDPWLSMKKSIMLSFIDKETVLVEHELLNTGKDTKKCSLWGVTSVAPCGTEYIPLHYRDGGMDPLHRVSMWDYTSLGDNRVKYERTSITLEHTQVPERYKIGVGHPAGAVTYINKGVIFEKSFNIAPEMIYPDGDVSYETFMCRHMVEIESLSPLYELIPGKTISHNEVWKLKKV